MLHQNVLERNIRGHAFSTYAKFSEKLTNMPYPLIRTGTCKYLAVRCVFFSENFTYVLNG